MWSQTSYCLSKVLECALDWRPDIPPGDAPAYRAAWRRALADDIAARRAGAGRAAADPARTGAPAGPRRRHGDPRLCRGRRARPGQRSWSGAAASSRRRRGEPAGGSTTLDLARNHPPAAPARARLPAAMARLARDPLMTQRLGYAPSGGFEADRRAGAAWLAHVAGWDDLDPARVICTAGAQQAVAVAFTAACRPGDTIIAEAATFFGLKSLAAAQSGLQARTRRDGRRGPDPRRRWTGRRPRAARASPTC